MLASAQRMLHERELLQQDLNSVAGKPKGRLSIGAVPTAMPVAARFSAMLQARHPGIAPVVRSMRSSELENGLKNLSFDMGLGYTERMARHGPRLRHVPQYTEHYFLVRRAGQVHSEQLQIGPKISWRDASESRLCLLTREMHNRTIVDAAFEAAGKSVKPVIETNSVLTLALSVVVGDVCSVLPGALIGSVRGYRELEALPLTGPDVRTAIGFMIQGGDRTSRTSRTLDAAMSLAQDAAWLRHAAAHSGLLAA